MVWLPMNTKMTKILVRAIDKFLDNPGKTWAMIVFCSLVGLIMWPEKKYTLRSPSGHVHFAAKDCSDKRHPNRFRIEPGVEIVVGEGWQITRE